MHATDDATPKGPRHERIVLRQPPHVEHPEAADLAAAIKILNSRELGDEIWAANNNDPNLEA